MMNTQQNKNHYGVEWTSQANQLLPGSLPVDDQAGSGRQSVTGINTTTEKRKAWSRQDNINAMECFYLSQPERRGYMKRMLQLWKERRLFDATDQRLADQVRVIRRKGLMSDLELEEIRNRVLNIPPAAGIENSHIEEQERPSEANVSNNTDGMIQTGDNEDIPTSEETEIIEKLKEKIDSITTKRTMPRVKKIPRDKIKRETEKVNRAMGFVDTTDIGGTNDLIYAGAHVVLDRLKAHRDKENNNRDNREPPWKRRLKKKVEEIRKDLGMLHNIKDGKKQATSKFKYKYRLTRKGVTTVIEELSQRLKSTAAKIKRYSERVNQFHLIICLRLIRRDSTKE